MIIIAHNIRSLHNVGSILRSADAFGIERVYLTGYTGQPPRKEIAKVALGSDQRVDWRGHDDVLQLISMLKQEGWFILGLDNVEQAIPIQQLEIQKPIVLILGNEVDGIESAILAHCDAVCIIEMIGRKQSLNVSVAAGIAMFALHQKNG